MAKDRWCNEKLGVCTHMKVESEDLHKVVDNILATKPKYLANDDFVDKMYEQMAKEIAEGDTDREIIKAVHISDVHIDMEYAEGSAAKCGSFLCCRAKFGQPAPGDPAAGEWGFNGGVCDIPQKTFQSLMQFVVEDITPDAIFWTGDNSSHNIWSNTVEEVTGYTETVTNIIKDAVKDTTIQVMPIHGNHDTWPVDEQDFSSPNSNYSINHIQEYWRDWLDEEAYEKYGEYGYYSMDISTLKNGKSLPAGSRLIAYNTNACDVLNFNVWGERHDPGHQIEWLEQQLMEVEAQNGLAIMMGHYTPVNCQHEFGVRFRALMERFQNVIRFGLTGHTHLESYQVNSSMTNPEKPVVVTSVGGSVTTYDFMNPTFMVIDFDSKTMLPVNMHTYYIDVDAANKTGKPSWEELHDYRDTYKMKDLSPSSFKDLAVRIFTDKDLATQFQFNKRRQNPNAPLKVDQLAIYCDLVTSEMHQLNECNKTGGVSAYGTDFTLFSKNIGKYVVDNII